MNSLRPQYLAVTTRWSKNTSDKPQKLLCFDTFVLIITIKFLWHCSCPTVHQEQLNTNPLPLIILEQHLFCKLRVGGGGEVVL